MKFGVWQVIVRANHLGSTDEGGAPARAVAFPSLHCVGIRSCADEVARADEVLDVGPVLLRFVNNAKSGFRMPFFLIDEHDAALERGVARDVSVQLLTCLVEYEKE